MTNLRTKRRLALLLPAIAAIASCGGNGEIDNQLSLRIIQASPDAPLVNFLIDGARVRQLVNYKGGYGSVLITPGTYELEVEAILPGEDAPLIDPAPKVMSAGKDYTYIVIGKDADNNVEFLEFESPIEDVPESNVRVQVAHAAPDVGPVDVYLTAPGALLANATPIAEATYGDLPGARQLVPSGAYVISVTPAGEPGTVLFDTGEITLASRQDLLLVAVANTMTDKDAVPISLVVNSFRLTSEILDKDLPSDIRVMHLSPDAPSLDVTASPSASSFPDIPLTSQVNPTGIALDSAGGRALIVDNRVGAVVAVDLQTGARTVLSDSSTPDALNPLRGPVGIALDSANGRALVTDNILRAVVAVDLQSGARSILSGGLVPDAANQFARPAGIALDAANGRALVIDGGLGAVVAVNLQEGTRTILSNRTTPDGSNPFSGPVGIVLDAANGRALVTDNRLLAVLEVDLQSGERRIVSNNTDPDNLNPFSGPVGIALDSANGRALVVDNRLGAVLAVNLQSGARTIVSNSVTPNELNPFFGSVGIALNTADGRALVVDNRVGSVLAVDLQGGARTVLSSSATPNGLSYLGGTSYQSLQPDTYSLTGAQTSDSLPTTLLFGASRSMFAGQRSTLIVDGLLANISSPLILGDDIRPVHAEGRLRIVNAAPASGTVDVYILDPETPIGSATSGVFNFPLGGATAHIGYEPENYTVTFTKAGDKTMVLATRDVAATAGTVQTVILVDEARVEGNNDGNPPSVLLIDDLAN